MSDRAYIERQPNWQATFERTRPGVRERFDCLMRTVKGGFYWCTPDYQGAFGWGATRDFHADWTRSLLAEGSLRLAAGTLPECLTGENDEQESRL